MKTKKQLENAMVLFKELMRQRRRKILQLAFVSSETGISKRDFDNMLDFEKKLFEHIMQEISYSDGEMQASMNGGSLNDNKHIMVFCKKHVEPFVGLDGEPLGPFEEGQIVNLDKEIADILIADDKFEAVDEH
jgi:hypothetical protein